MILLADGISHVCGGIQEKSRTDLDHETSREVAGEGNFSLPKTERHRRLEKGFCCIFLSQIVLYTSANIGIKIVYFRIIDRKRTLGLRRKPSSVCRKHIICLRCYRERSRCSPLALTHSVRR